MYRQYIQFVPLICMAISGSLVSQFYLFKNHSGLQTKIYHTIPGLFAWPGFGVPALRWPGISGYRLYGLHCLSVCSTMTSYFIYFSKLLVATTTVMYVIIGKCAKKNCLKSRTHKRNTNNMEVHSILIIHHDG